MFDEITEAIVSIFNNKLDLTVSRNDFEKNFIDIGLNSLTFIKLLINLEIRFDVEFEEDFINISRVGNLQQLVTYVLSQLDR